MTRDHASSPHRGLDDTFITVALVAAGLVHLLPAIGVAGGGTLERLYGLSPEDADVELLLRHRAVLFGLLGVATLAAAVRRRHRVEVIAANLLSVTTFVVLAASTDWLTDKIRRVAIIDAALVPLLVIALAVAARRNRRASGARSPADGSQRGQRARRDRSPAEARIASANQAAEPGARCKPSAGSLISNSIKTRSSAVEPTTSTRA